MAEVIAALSLATDLGMGEPQERAMRCCLVAMRMADVIGVDARDRVQAYYLPQLGMLGCTADSSLASSIFGDELVIGPRMSPLIFGPQKDMLLWVLRNIGAGEPPLKRAQRLARMVAYGAGGGMTQASAAHCEVAQHLGMRLDLPKDVLDSLGYVFEHWDGSGAQHVKGDGIPLPIRIAHLAWDVELGERLGGSENCVELVREHSGIGLDPDLVDRFCRAASDVLAVLDVASVWDAVVAAEPGPARVLADSEVDTAASIFADFTDFKSAYTSEHSRRVATLAADAAQRCGLDATNVTLVRRAGLVHDVGRVAVSASVWDRPGPLGDAEIERVRLHAYHTERVLRRAGALAAAGALAGLHHERLDGSGYHRGVRGSDQSSGARILAAADAFAAMTEPRAYRAALSPELAAETLQTDAETGHLDPEAVKAVIEAAGQRPRRTRREWPAGLSEREVEVLGLLARGLSMKEIAQRLVVSPKTVDHHVQHIYTKVDVRTRPGARLFAIEHGLAYDGPLV